MNNSIFEIQEGSSGKIIWGTVDGVNYGYDIETDGLMYAEEDFSAASAVDLVGHEELNAICALKNMFEEL